MQESSVHSESEELLRVARLEIIESIRSKRIERALLLMKEKVNVVLEERYV